MSNYEIITLEELLAMLEKYNHNSLHVHHTWKPSHADYYNAKAANEDERAINRQKAFRDFHVNTNGWADIAQHVTLLPDGRFVTGRDFARSPASISGYNTGAFMVEMIGNFDTGNDPFKAPQRTNMIGLARWFDNRGKYIRFHNENSSKTCPGTGIVKANFMAEVRGAAAPTSNVLKRGSQGTGVKTLQEDLQALGFSPGVPDGVYGALTEEAVKALQRTAGITADGVVGSETLAAIAKMLQAPDYKQLYEDLQAKMEQIKKIAG